MIYSNADDEAVTAIRKTLDENGYQGQYILQTFGTSELGGKLLAEGKNLEADLITMSTFYIDSAQESQQMFKDLDFDLHTFRNVPFLLCADYSTGRSNHCKYKSTGR